MAHEKVYGFCENKCKVEVAPKTETDAVEERVTKLEDVVDTEGGVISANEVNCSGIIKGQVSIPIYARLSTEDKGYGVYRPANSATINYPFIHPVNGDTTETVVVELNLQYASDGNYVTIGAQDVVTLETRTLGNLYYGSKVESLNSNNDCNARYTVKYTEIPYVISKSANFNILNFYHKTRQALYLEPV